MKSRRPAPFSFAPATFVPFRDQRAVKKVRAIRRQDITRHRNPGFRITVMPDAELEHRWITDMFFRISEAMAAGRNCVMIMPNPWPGYAKLAAMLNRARVDCRRLHTFNMDEYADEHGRIAPETWEFGFGHAFKKYFYAELDPKLRPPERQIRVFTAHPEAAVQRVLRDREGAQRAHARPHLFPFLEGAGEFRRVGLDEREVARPPRAAVADVGPAEIGQHPAVVLQVPVG
ncbi:MAG: hypothetical protein ACKOTE_05675, partial [Opitutaceae bacterium]